MIIVCGAGSGLAKITIDELSKRHKILAISRNSKYDGNNITNVNLESYSDIKNVIEGIDSENITWVNFVAHSNDSLLLNLSDEHLTQDFDLNFDLNFQASKILLPKMVASKHGRFIFISSSRALKGDVGTFSYSLGKKATITLQEQIVREYARFGITANTLALGYYDTRLWHKLSDSLKKNLLQDTPTKKLSDPRCIAPTIEIILQHATINNNVIKLDDGFR